MTLGREEKRIVAAALGDQNTANKVTSIMDLAADGAYGVSFSVGAETANAIETTLTFTGVDGTTLTSPVMVDIMIVSSTSTNALNTTDYTVAAGASGGVIAQLVADQVVRGITTSAGVLKVVLTLASGAATSFLAVRLANGKITHSPAITHAA